MKLIITKLDAAKSQVLEAINLFFEERDPVSIHTLAGAALQILHDHFDDIGQVWDHNLIFHYDSIYAKDEHRKEYADKVREAKNFFKHAERDLRNGQKSIEFNTESNVFYILEAMRCLKIIEGTNHVFYPEFKVFISWYGLKYPEHFTKEGKDFFKTLPHMNPDDPKAFRDAIALLKANPQLWK
jgi:hypothetical protein